EIDKDDHVFINMGNRIENGVAIPYFEDQAKKLGLNDNSNTNHVCFIDYDHDNDLDLFLLNHRIGFKETSTLRLKQGEDGKTTRITTPTSPYESNRLYRNDNGHFTDVTIPSGMESSAWGLSATAADINADGWLDIYIGNDYVEPDRIMINNHDGTFTDKYFDYLKHSSQNSMGADVADINNDGLVDIMVLDMKPENPIRYKELSHVMQYDRYHLLEEHGYGRQVGRNVLQLNNGNNTFSEIGQYAGVSKTDWSWGTLLADFDNDGWKDNYIANGYRKDVTNFDYFNYTLDSLQRTGGVTKSRFPDISTVIDLIPETKLSNYLFINNGKLQFINVTKQAGLDKPTFSNGAAYADLDRDGDLDIITNNMMDPASIYRNDISGKHWLQIDLEYKKGNSDGLGTVANLYAAGNSQLQVMMTNKGFFSTSEPIFHFGLGSATIVDSVILQWPDGNKEIMKNVKADQRIFWKPGMGARYTDHPKQMQPPIFASKGNLSGWIHQEDAFVDFKRERLIPYMLSFEGPCISTGDINGDKLDDVFAGNGSGYPSALFLQTSQSTFEQAPDDIFQSDALHEDCGSVLEDLDADGDLDLVVISGGSSFSQNDPAYMVRHYLNDGKGSFSKSQNFPIIRVNAGTILAFDFDADNDKDLFIGGRSVPGAFPQIPKSYLLQNDKGKFTDVTKDIFPEFDNLGMITDMKTGDLDKDGADELVVVGDWMPIMIFSFDGSKFHDETDTYSLSKLTGWWKTIVIDDLDGDGDMDLVAGNMGLNHRLETSELYPITLISKDFDDNGSQDPILSYYYEGKLYPYAGRDAIIGQVPMLKKKYVRYEPYASATVEDIFTKDKLKKSTELTANTFKTMCLINDQKKFTTKELPYQTQLNPVYDILIDDFNGDGRKDILMAGNFLYAETETGEMDAGNGTLLLQKPDGSFEYVLNVQHGFWAQHEVRELDRITLADGSKAILTGNNKGPIEMHVIAGTAKQVQ
ncbi:MAG TPA: VCBS repeat-containing protein, partial [Saprospiraceae bacterium]|nr:VCBS repeat-containing protein [Saprospiraceae bacterium]